MSKKFALKHKGGKKPNPAEVLSGMSAELVSEFPEYLDSETFNREIASCALVVLDAVLRGDIQFTKKQDYEQLLILCGLAPIPALKEKLATMETENE